MSADLPETVLAAALGRLRAAWPQVRRLTVGFSGGLDSTVLLHALVRRAPAGCTLDALHIDHGWRPESAGWARQCVARAAALGIGCRVVRVQGVAAAGELGMGQVVDVAMIETSMPFAIAGFGMAFGGQTPKAGAEALTGGIAPYQTYATKDGRAMTLAALEPKFWLAFSSGIGRQPDMSEAAFLFEAGAALR